MANQKTDETICLNGVPQHPELDGLCFPNREVFLEKVAEASRRLQDGGVEASSRREEELNMIWKFAGLDPSKKPARDLLAGQISKPSQEAITEQDKGSVRG